MKKNTMETKKVYKETMDKILHDKKMTQRDFAEMVGQSVAYYPNLFAKGYKDVTVRKIAMWSKLLDISEDEITAIPKAKKTYTIATEAEEIAKESAKTQNLAELYALLIDGFRMIHQDIQILTDTMHKYWKPEEPKYEVKEREQP